MKVFATVIENDAVKLVAWPSIKAFESTESWVDGKFLAVTTTKDLDIYECSRPSAMFVLSVHQLKSYSLLHAEYMKRHK